MPPARRRGRGRGDLPALRRRDDLDEGELALPRLPVQAGLLRLAVAVAGGRRVVEEVGAGTKNRLPVTAVEKSRIRSVVPGGLPTNMFVSISSMTSGLRA
jgi:hypothetical protein